jgi:AcrR family transcriptional regulator
MRIRKNAAERRDEVIEATLRLASEIGPDRITTEAIAKAVGLSQAAVFRHFPRKEDIWIAVIEWLRSQFAEQWLRSDTLERSPERRLRAVVRNQLEFIRAKPGLPMILMSRELHTRNDLLRQAIAVMMEMFHRHLSGIFDDGKKCGEFVPDLEVERAAYLVISMIHGLALRWILRTQAFDIVSDGERTLDIALRGILARQNR